MVRESFFSTFQFGNTNFDVQKFLESNGVKNPLSFITKTGPSQLKHAGPEEDSLSLGLASSCKLAQLYPGLSKRVETLISVTESPAVLFPGNSSTLASCLKLAESTQLLDINAGCTGFVDAVSLSFKIKTPTLIVCSETYSKHDKNQNRATRCLFSDASAATFFDPSKFELVYEDFIFKKNTSSAICVDKFENLVMDGTTVFQFLNTHVVPLIEKAFKKHPDITKLFCHQGSALVVSRIISLFSRPELNIASNITNRGNSVSSTIPILIEDTHEDSPVTSDDLILLVGFGVGLQAHLLVFRPL